MKRIRITRLIPAGTLRESEAMRQALIGAKINVDTPGVVAKRESHPDIPPSPPGMYEATLDEVLLALGTLGRYEAEVDWRIYAPHLIRIPHAYAELLEL